MIDLINKINDLLTSALPVLIAGGVVYFIWGVILYVIAGGEEAKKKGRDHIVSGIIGLAVILSMWALVALLTTFVGTNSAPTTDINNLIVQAPTKDACPDLNLPNLKLADYLNYVTCFIGQSVIPLIFAIATMVFIWGAVNFFIIGGSEEEKRKQGRQLMLWGIIGFVVMLSVWSLVHIVGSTFGFSSTFLPKVSP